MTDPREDALAKAREALTYALHEFTAMRHYAARDVVEPALAALSAPPSQSEPEPKMRETWAAAAAQTASHRRDYVIEAIHGRVALTPSPTPYVRPAAEIRAEIERVQRDPGNYGWVCHLPVIAALQWTLTPPTQEPR